MDFIDDEADASQDDEILVLSSQGLPSSHESRPNKRRRLNRSPAPSEGSTSSRDEYDLPSNDQELEDEFDNPRPKHDAIMHVPIYAETQQDQFVTQVEQPWSSPTAIRGPRWRKKGATPPSEPASPTRLNQKQSLPAPTSALLPGANRPVPVVVDEFDDDDVEVIEALMVSESNGTISHNPMHSVQPKQSRVPLKSMRQTTLFGISTTQRDVPAATQTRVHSWPMASRNEPPTHHKIDQLAMQTWIYPLNVGSIRDYQFNIVHRALFHNILVALPTGLGKTFIAATVMLNYFNWTRDAQIIFVAPTKPLVTQQVNACFNIAGIPRSSTTLLTGEIQPAIRAEQWQEKRVFFMTPQTLINDLKTGMADPKKIVLLVVDEAHKATGNYAYVEVVRFLRRFNSSFRVLALTATPGATVEAVQKVIDGLDIARVEIRTEESMDIRRFVHTRNENYELFDNSPEIDMCLDLFATAVRPVLAKVNGLNAYFSNDPKTMTLYGLMKGKETWAKSDAGRNASYGVRGMVQACFKPLMSLAHNLELLKYHGIGPFYHKMKIFDEESTGKYGKQIMDSDSYKTLMGRLKVWVNDDSFVGHPKLTYLNEVVLNHFMDAGDGLGAAGGRPPSDTRIMVFAHYRDSAEEIVRVLNRHQPMVRAHVFVGQSGTKGSEGMDQKSQINIIQKFKAGTYNTVVATSIGEEGLDIGEVDLIVCYDCSKSPIRMLQRMGRTGRKRAGNIVLLLMRGKEERDYHAAKDNYLKMQAIIESGKEFQFHDEASPRIVPRDIQPVVDKRHVEIPIENTQAEPPEPRKRKGRDAKRPPKKFHMPDNVETGFQFLGPGNKQKKVKAKEPVQLPKLDIQDALVPPLQDVILSGREERELEQRFAQVAGHEIQYVQAVRMDAFPKVIRSSGKTGLVRHSAVTGRLLKASKAMHGDRDWQRPSPPVNVEVSQEKSPPDSQELFDQVDDDNNGRELTGAKFRALSTGLNQDQDRESSISGSEKSPLDAFLDKPFYVSQQSVQNVDSEADELPNMDELFKENKSRTLSKSFDTSRSEARSKLGAKASRRGRRVLSDDSDE